VESRKLRGDTFSGISCRKKPIWNNSYELSKILDLVRTNFSNFVFLLVPMLNQNGVSIHELSRMNKSNHKLRRNVSNISIGGRALIPHKGILNETVELRELESSSLLLLRDIK
jgi:hypothetical protein